MSLNNFLKTIDPVVQKQYAMEKKMWTIAGAIAIISFVVSPIGQRVVGTILTSSSQTSIIQGSN